MPRPLLIGVTGGIGAGKSTVVAALAERGAAVFSADQAVHSLYEDADVQAQVRARWGDRVFTDAGDVDRVAIADIVFPNEEERQWLEGLLHPLVAREWLRFLDAQQRAENPPTAIVAEVPLLFEADLSDRYDAVMVVTAPLEMRLERVGTRAHGASHATSRANAQLSDAEKCERADVVLDNTRTLDDLRRDTLAAFDSLMAERSA
jgi:dephospho-CoA kinase